MGAREGVFFLKVSLSLQDLSLLYLCVYVYVHANVSHVCEVAHGGQKTVCNHLELYVQTVVKHPDIDAWNWTQVLWKSSKDS